MKANEYKILEECVERGISAGYNKAFKYSDKPSQQEIEDSISQYVLLEICEYFEFNNNQQEK